MTLWVLQYVMNVIVHKFVSSRIKMNFLGLNIHIKKIKYLCENFKFFSLYSFKLNKIWFSKNMH